jgi:alpha-amylase/alpha-mannosidase (GH57 family)
MRKLQLVLCWHMHQPDYRNSLTGEFELPWTYLHAIKDYTDMAWHLEQHPEVAAVVNFVPSLLDQLEDYERQYATGQIRDSLLALLAVEDLHHLTLDQRRHILDCCFRSNHTRMIEPFPAYKRMLSLFALLEERSELQAEYLSVQYLADLLVWYHLSWMGESVRRTDELIPRLMAQNCLYTYQDRKQLFDLIGRLIREIVPRYRKLQDEGRIEISTTPYYHPILPLMLDFGTAREAMPDAALPRVAGYPGGTARACEQTAAAIENHMRHFGRPPQGMWPAEGGVSSSALELLADHGVGWSASGESVLTHTLQRIHGETIPQRPVYLYRPYRYPTQKGAMTCFFRDDRLSDKIGFEYSRWHGSDAVSDFIHALEEIYRDAPQDAEPVVSVILDGENAWEYYPYNGYYFLAGLYDALKDHPFIQTTTFSDCAQRAVEILPSLVSGSWVYGTFSTWIGSPEKNRAWDLLSEAKNNFDLVMASGRLSPEERRLATRQLAICEGSDWFWWFGDYNPAPSVKAFDRLYRLNLTNLYQLIRLPVPVELLAPISTGGGSPAAAGTMRRASE